jgi:hypothetical protein
MERHRLKGELIELFHRGTAPASTGSTVHNGAGGVHGNHNTVHITVGGAHDAEAVSPAARRRWIGAILARSDQLLARERLAVLLRQRHGVELLKDLPDADLQALHQVVMDEWR